MCQKTYIVNTVSVLMSFLFHITWYFSADSSRIFSEYVNHLDFQKKINDENGPNMALKWEEMAQILPQ